MSKLWSKVRLLRYIALYSKRANNVTITYLSMKKKSSNFDAPRITSNS